MVVLDNYAGFADMFDEPGDMAIGDILTRLVADGPGVGILTIVTAKHPGDIPTRLSSLIACKLAFRLADRYDYSGLGIPAVEPPLIPGRAFEARSGREIQVAVASRDGLGAAVAGNRWRTSLVVPWEIDVLPQEVAITDVIAVGHISPDEWFLPLGIGDTALSPVGLVLRDGEHALITGPARSGLGPESRTYWRALDGSISAITQAVAKSQPLGVPTAQIPRRDAQNLSRMIP